MKIDEKYIEIMIDTLRKDGVIPCDFDNAEQQEAFREAVLKIADDFINAGEENTSRLYTEKIDRELPLVLNDKNVIGSNLLFSILISTHDFILKKYYKKDVFQNVIANLVRHSLEIYQDICRDILTQSVEGILSRVRAIYEAWAIELFICEYEELAQAFLDHKKMMFIQLAESMKTNQKIETLRQKKQNKICLASMVKILRRHTDGRQM